MLIFGIEICPIYIKAFIALVVLAFLFFVSVIGALKFYAYYTCGYCKDQSNMESKVVIVTGATSGIGKETARELAKRGAKVILACRNVDKANKTREEIVKSTNNEKILVKRLDLSSQKSIREFAEDFNKSESKLDVLIHNAGTAESRLKLSEDGIEMNMATNHFGPFLLTHLLIDALKKSSPSRIVVVASELYRLASLNLEKLNNTNALIPAYIYYISKYANICFTRELARRLEGTNVTANCLHPGMIDSGIWRNVPAPLSWPLMGIVKGFFKNTVQGCQTTVHLAVAEKLEKVTGKYFMDCKERGLSSGALDNAKARKLWEMSEKIVQLQENDLKI